eukprot:898001-Amphidinium_carterae.1
MSHAEHWPFYLHMCTTFHMLVEFKTAARGIMKRVLAPTRFAVPRGQPEDHRSSETRKTDQ